MNVVEKIVAARCWISGGEADAVGDCACDDESPPMRATVSDSRVSARKPLVASGVDSPDARPITHPRPPSPAP